MSKDQLKDKFIELRIKGETFDSIAKELKVSKQTLINWSKERNIKETITAAQLIKYQSILKMYKHNREGKINYFYELLKKLKEEFNSKDLQN